MSSSKRRPPQTLFDWLESEGFLLPHLAKSLRDLGAGTAFTDRITDLDVRHTLGELILRLHAPKNPAAYITHLQAYAMTEELRYYREQLGDAAATKRTAESWGVSRGTVLNAARQFRWIPTRPKLSRTDPSRQQLREHIERLHHAILALQENRTPRGSKSKKADTSKRRARARGRPAAEVRRARQLN